MAQPEKDMTRAVELAIESNLQVRDVSKKEINRLRQLRNKAIKEDEAVEKTPMAEAIVQISGPINSDVPQ